MKELLAAVRAAAERYDMICEGDVIAVGVSGGKDSLALLCALARMREFYPKKFILKAISIDPVFFGKETDFDKVQKLCDDLRVEYIIRRTRLYSVVFEERKEANPCSLCAKMRRGILHDEAIKAGCNKIALGHNEDDAAETFMMNLLNGGKIACFSPVTYLSRKNIYVIRPLIFCDEKKILRAVGKNNLPVIPSPCPMDKISERKLIKDLIFDLDREYNSLRSKITGALQKGNISGW